jgi:hypothetical protein
MAPEGPRDKEPASDAEPGPEQAKRPDPGLGAKADGQARPKNEPGNPGKGAKDGVQSESKGDQQAAWTVFLQTFYGTDARNSVFGAGAPGAGTAGPEPRSYGRMGPEEVAKVSGHYAEPPCFAEALAELKVERVVILLGPAWTGRRAGGTTLLDRVKPAEQPIVGLAPGTTVDQLAARTFDKGVGYLIADMIDADMSQENAEYHWGNACRAVREAEAYLVVTAAAGVRIARSTAARTFSWQRPAVADVLRKHLGSAVVKGSVIDETARALEHGATLGKVAETAHRMATATPEQMADVLAALADNDPREVADWLDKVDAAIPEVLEVAAVAFTAGLPERLIDAELREFKSQIAKFAPEVDPSKDEVKKEIDLRFRQVRKMRAEHPLLAVHDVRVAMLASVPIRHLDFAKANYRSDLITELWQQLDTDFWDGIRWWINEIAEGGQLNLMSSAATGLALLAQRAPDEVIDCYLEPWTAEDASWNEQLMAILVIGQMSEFGGDMATLALQIVLHWATHGSRTQRRVATYAFSGGLGARFPVDATRKLAHLADQGEPLAGNGHAVLFMNLAGQGAYGALVLGELQRRMNRPQRDRPAADRVLDNVVFLLAIRDMRTGQPAIGEFLMANPDRVGAAAPLWARAFVLRPWRERAGAALLATLAAIERGQPSKAGQRDPKPLVGRLGAAIGKALPPEERTGLRPDLVRANQKNKQRDRWPRPDDGPGGEDGQEPAGRPGTGPPSGPAGNGSARPEVSPELLEVFLNACANPDHRELG